MKKNFLNPANMASPPSKYSHGVKVETGSGTIIFISGQIARDKEGNIVGAGDIAAQTEFIFKEIETILEEGGALLSDVVKTTIFVTDMEQYPKVAKVRNRYFRTDPPTSTLVEVSRLVKEECMIEVEAIAVIPK